MELGKIIAINLNELRTERNLTLGQLSKISGISKAMLSDIEKGNSNPTINTLWKIAKQFYGNGSQYSKIVSANSDKIKNPNLIYPGQVFSIPA